MGQQVGNCKIFTLTHYLANLFAMHCDPRASPLWIWHYIKHASLLFQVDQPFHSLNMAIKNLTLKIKGQGHGWSQSSKSQLESSILSTHILWFHVNSPSYCYDKAFLNLAFKIQGQSHSSQSHTRYNILSTPIPFVPCWSAPQYLRYSYLKSWPWKSKFKFMG